MKRDDTKPPKRADVSFSKGSPAQAECTPAIGSLSPPGPRTQSNSSVALTLNCGGPNSSNGACGWAVSFAMPCDASTSKRPQSARGAKPGGGACHCTQRHCQRFISLAVAITGEKPVQASKAVSSFDTWTLRNSGA
eukprot:6196688-Pleurochrysis_carterae.AAC.1